MLTDLSRISQIAIFGMDASAPGSEGLPAFGRLVFRGLTAEATFDGPAGVEQAVLANIRRACAAAGIQPARVPIFCLSPQLYETLQGSREAGQVMDFSGEANPLVSALSAAADWTITSAGAVALVESLAAPQTTCCVIAAGKDFAASTGRTSAALFLAAFANSAPLTSRSVEQTCRGALESAGVCPEEVGLIVASGAAGGPAGIEESYGLAATYPPSGDLTCALHSGEGGLISLVKAAWCLNRRVIPGKAALPAPGLVEALKESSFYVPAESRTWFTTAGQPKRLAGVNLAGQDGGFAHILLGEGDSNPPAVWEALKEETLSLFMAGAGSAEGLALSLGSLQAAASNGSGFSLEAAAAYWRWLAQEPRPAFTACLLARSPAELERETGFALKGIPAALVKGGEWQTPAGSYFTAAPLGGRGSTAFVYPGAFNSYPGMARDLFYLFPPLYERFSAMTERMGALLNERSLYPRSLAPLSPADLNEIESRLAADPLGMLMSGSSTAVVYTALLREIFEIRPACALGYSLGETSMMFASGAWMNGDEVSGALCASPLFQTRLAGPQQAVRETWKLPPLESPGGQLWENYILMAAPERVRELLPDEPRVYMTHINTPRQVVIGGDPQGCRRIIERLKCSSLRAPFNYALHCAAMQSEYEALVNLHSWPVCSPPEMTLYSAATARPMPADRQSIARQIARGLCMRVDFPRLVQQAYADGARIFVELGAGSNCARWVDESLKDQPHASFSINRKGVDDHTSILRLAARLASHHVQANLDPLFR